MEGEKLKIPSPRVQILEKIDELQNKHCGGCKLRNKMRACPNSCEINIQIKNLGALLTDHKAKNVRKHNVSNIKIVKKEVVVLNIKGLTKEIFLKSKDEGMSDKKIMDKYVVDNSTFYKMKNEWGLVKGIAKKGEVKSQTVDDKEVANVFENVAIKNRLKDANEKIASLEIENANSRKNLELAVNVAKDLKERLNVVSVDRDIAIKDYTEKDEIILRLQKLRSEDVEVIDKLKEKISDLECDASNFDAQLSEREEIIARLEKWVDENDASDEELEKTKNERGELFNKLAHSENRNDSLVDQINSLKNYKVMYFKTAETLKLHLPN